MEIFIFWVIFSFLAATIGGSRNIGFWPAFLLSIFLSPLVGLIAVFASKHKSDKIQVEKTTKDSTKFYIEELKELSKLKEQNVISDEEFQEKKKQILKNV